MRRSFATPSRQQSLALAAACWLLAGAALLLTTLIPAHTPLLGWSPAFWLVIAPLAVLLVLEPSLPGRLLALCRPRRRATASAIWH